MSAIGDYLIWLDENYPEAHTEVPVNPRYCEEFLAERVAKRELEELEE
jgi:hypothetical protein